MKSPLVRKSPAIARKHDHSDLQVLKTSMGYFVGTVKITTGNVVGSQDSPYFKTAREAHDLLDLAVMLGDQIADQFFYDSLQVTDAVSVHCSQVNLDMQRVLCTQDEWEKDRMTGRYHAKRRPHA